MRKKLPWEWEKLDTETFRAKVVGGWVLKSISMGRKCQSMTFVHDIDHEWMIMQPHTNQVKSEFMMPTRAELKLAE
jgi:hypothetical protein